eukprot:4925653-Pyramimonas_sp.AAC.1
MQSGSSEESQELRVAQAQEGLGWLAILERLERVAHPRVTARVARHRVVRRSYLAPSSPCLWKQPRKPTLNCVFVRSQDRVA